jgi:putative phosphoesterase
MPPADKHPIHVGVISDTHGLLRPEAVRALAGSELIVHAGDVGNPAILTALEKLAPVRAVRGNIDAEPWAARLPETLAVEAGGARLWVVHMRDALGFEPGPAGFDAVIFGHSHRPRIERHDGVLYLNPGSAGPRRFRLPVTVARLTITGKTLESEIVELAV